MVNRIYLYNLLNGGQVALGALFQFLLAHRFGAGTETDVYFLSVVVVTFLSAFSLFFSEMFLQHYNDLHVKDPSDAEVFYQAVFTQAIALGLLSCLVGIVLFPVIVGLFAPGLEEGRLSLFRSFFLLHSISLIFSRAQTLNNSLINANMRFLLPYLLGITAQAVQICFLLFLSDLFGIFAVAIAATAASVLCLAVQIAFIGKVLGVRVRPRLWHPAIRPLAASSVSLRMGHQIWSLRDLLTTNILSHAPAGALSIFSYAMKVVSVIFAVTNSPVLQIFQAKASRLASEGSFGEVRYLQREATIKNVRLFAVAVLPAVIFLPVLLKAFFGEAIPGTSLSTIYFLFLALIPVHVLLSVEMPYVQVVIALKRRRVVLLTAIIFIAAYFIALKAGFALFGIFGIPAAMLSAQLLNIVIYVRYVNWSIARFEWNAQPVVP